MARCRDVLLAGLLLGGTGASSAATAMPPAAAPFMPHGATPAQYFHQERGYAPPRYAPAPRRRQVCWTEQRRYRVGYDQWGRAVYRIVPERVCRWRYY